MNSVGMNTKITMWPKSVHYVRELTYCGPEEWDPDEGRNIRWEIGREYIILKANGRTKKFWKYMDEGKRMQTLTRQRKKSSFGLTGGCTRGMSGSMFPKT